MYVHTYACMYEYTCIRIRTNKHNHMQRLFASVRLCVFFCLGTFGAKSMANMLRLCASFDSSALSCMLAKRLPKPRMLRWAPLQA